MKKKLFILGVIVLTVSVGIYYYLTRSSQPTFTWKTQTLQRGDVVVTITATGPINPLQTVQVGTQVSGTVAKLLADFNSEVRKGQLIALIDTTLLSASRQDAEASRQKAEIQLQEMKREFDRADKLFKGGVLPQADYDVASTNYQSAISALAAYKAQLNRAKINLKYASIFAPINGTVISRNVDVGQTVVASFNTPTLFTIANDLSKMEVYANVDEADIGQIKVGQKAMFTVDAYPEEIFEGEIKQIRLQPSVVQNVVNYTVLIDVANPEMKLLPGLTANINVKINEHKNILKVSSAALHFSPPQSYFDYTEELPDSLKTQIMAALSPGKKYVWVKRRDQLFPVEVTTGLSDGAFIEISGNVKEGEEIALASENASESAPAARSPFMPTFRRSGTR